LSQYSVTFSERAPYDACAEAASIMYYHYPWPSLHYPWPEYLPLAVQASEGLPCIVCTCNGNLVGALTLGDIGPDPHIAGEGVIVYNTVTHPEHPKATLLMYRFLIDLLRTAGASWYQTTSRISETEFTSKYRRLHGQGS
jgi:hypothetical protein